MKDVLTDLNAEGEVLPLSPPREDWFGHKGMVQAAEYIRKKLQEEDIIARARAKVYRVQMSRASSLVIGANDSPGIIIMSRCARYLHNNHNNRQ